MVIPGSEYLTKIIHAASQSLLIPVILGLIILLIYALMELGGIIGEKKKRAGQKWIGLVETLHNVGDIHPWKVRNLHQVVDNIPLTIRQKKLINDFLSKAELPKDAKELIARDIMDQEESGYRGVINKTDLLAKIGPMLGLMGTLIPLGPGLGALGQGDFKGLSQAIIVAFDTTVLGMVIGGIGSFISKVRNRWYSQDLNSLEVVLDLIIGGEAHGCQEIETSAVVRRRS